METFASTAMTDQRIYDYQDVGSLKSLTTTSNPTSGQSFMYRLVLLGFNLVMRLVTGGGASSGKEDRCSHSPGTVETDSCPEPIGEDESEPAIAMLIQCKDCEAKIDVSETMKDDEIIEKHNKENPNCNGPTKLKQNAKTQITEENKKRTNNSTSSISALEENVCCDTESTINDDHVKMVHNQEPKSSASRRRPVARPWNPSKAKHPRYSKHRERVMSLLNWSNRSDYCIEDIAEAGLVFLGTGYDNLVCYFCNVSVPGLQKHDDVWIEHAMRSSDCDFIRHKMGQDYLDVIIDIYLDGDIEAVAKASELGGATGTDYTQTAVASGGYNETRPPQDFRAGLKGGAPVAMKSSPNMPTGNKTSPTRDVRGGLKGGAQNMIENSPKVNVPTGTTQTFRSVLKGGVGSSMPGVPNNKVPVQRKPRTPLRQVQAREVRARLDTDGAQRIVKMGFSAQLVGAVIAEQLIYKGDDFRSFSEMMMAVIEADEMGEAFPVNHYELGLQTKGGSTSLPPMSKTTDLAPIPPSPKSLPVTNLSKHPTREELKSLELENEKLKEVKICTVCYDLDRDVLFVPCGHLVVCHNCSPRLRSCPVCRRNIQGIVKVFL